jgi:hypothetical protein
MYQGLGRITSPSPSPKIRRGDRKSLCAIAFMRSTRKIIFALRLILSLLPDQGEGEVRVTGTLQAQPPAHFRSRAR